MKIKIQNYTFNSTSKTITFTDYTSITLDSILMITNVTSNKIIYVFNDPLKGGTVSANVLTLTYNTASMSSSDALQIWVDTGTDYPVTIDQLNDCLNVLRNALYLISNPSYLDKSANQIRAQITGTISTLTTCNTVNTVTTLTNMGGYTATMNAFDNNQSAWALTSRPTIA